MALPAPPIARLPTLVLLPEVQLLIKAQATRYQEALGDLLSVKTVPNGHNVLWEAPAETTTALEEFLASA
jgi:pimeloyl-ACP methyl ester carboxylesterase